MGVGKRWRDREGRWREGEREDRVKDISFQRFLTVSSGNDPSTSHSALYICSGVPSKNFPQPPINSVSPGKQETK